MSALRILLVGTGMHPHSNLAARLTAWGANCRFANSFQQASALLAQETYDVILGEMTLPDGPASQMIPLLRGSSVTLFCSLPVASGCLWIPVVEQGRDCRGARAWRPAELGNLLHRFITGALPISAPARTQPQPTNPRAGAPNATQPNAWAKTA